MKLSPLSDTQHVPHFQGLDWGVDAVVQAGGARFVGFLLRKMGPREEPPRETAEGLWREWL